jgi:hypothetical protein
MEKKQHMNNTNNLFTGIYLWVIRKPMAAMGIIYLKAKSKNFLIYDMSFFSFLAL